MRFGGKLFIQRGRLTLLALVLLSIILQFQNCGKKPGSTAALHLQLSPDSPFFDQRVRLDVPVADVTQSKAQQAAGDLSEEDASPIDPTNIVVLIHNACATEECIVSEESKSSLVCEITQNSKKIPGLESLIQGYPWRKDEAQTSTDLEEKIRSNFIDDKCIAGVSYNLKYNVEAYTTNDPGFGSQYFHDTINGAVAYDFFYKQALSQIKVGVIDSGVDTTHEDSGSGVNYNLSSECADICHWHGTHVAGIINGRPNNSKGGHGIAKNAYIYSYQVGNSSGRIKTVDIVNALQLAKTHKLDLINMSLGGTNVWDYAIQEGITANIAQGALVVVAAGNSSNNISQSAFYPASFNFDGQITVASASPRGSLVKHEYGTGGYYYSSAMLPLTSDQLSSEIILDPFSNYSGSLVHIAAPGANIYSNFLNNTYGAQQGTSFAAPMVTGALALIKGYLKANNYDVSPQILKTLLLEGSSSLESLNFVDDSGKLVTTVRGSKYLDLEKLKTSIEQFVEQNKTIPAQIFYVSSEVKEIDGKKQVHIKVDVRDGDLSKNLVLYAHTHSAFLDDSEVKGYECQIVSVRQVCDVVIDFNQLGIDPEVYLRVMAGGKTGSLISDLHIPKTAINFGDKTKATLKGDIVAAHYFNDTFEVEGWACLEGFADAIEIQMRINNKTAGTAAYFTVTNRQARGNYKTVCNSPEISLGFRFIVPKHIINSGDSSKLYFRAFHPETGKSFDIPVFTHQPSVEDSSPAIYTDHVFIDKNLSQKHLDVKITKREFKDFILTLEGSACYRNSYKPAIFSLGVDVTNVHKLFPQFRALFPGAIPTESSALATDGASLKSTISRSITSNNPSIRSNDNMGWIRDAGLHSDIFEKMIYKPNSNGEWKNFLIDSSNSLRRRSSAVTVTPNIELNDGCHSPSGFSVRFDLRSYIKQIKSTIDIVYRNDMYTEEQIKNLPAFQPQKNLFLLEDEVNDYNFSDLYFDPSAFNFFIESVFDSELKSVYFSNGAFERFSSERSRTFSSNQQIVPKGLFKYNYTDDVYYRSQSSVGHIDRYYDHILLSENSAFYPWDSYLWEEPLNLVLTESASLSLDQLYLSEVLPVSNTAFGLRAKITYDVGVSWTHTDFNSKIMRFGELNTDFKLQVKVNGAGPWYEVPLEESDYISFYRSGVLVGYENSVLRNATSVQFRILSNGKNQFRITTFGFTAE